MTRVRLKWTGTEKRVFRGREKKQKELEKKKRWRERFREKATERKKERKRKRWFLVPSINF